MENRPLFGTVQGSGSNGTFVAYSIRCMMKYTFFSPEFRVHSSIPPSFQLSSDSRPGHHGIRWK